MGDVVLPEVLCRFIELTEAMRVPLPMSVHPGCFTLQVDADWYLVMNGHETAQKHADTEVPPWTLYVEFQGWPAGYVNPSGGIIAAGGDATEQALIEALKARTAEVLRFGEVRRG